MIAAVSTPSSTTGTAGWTNPSNIFTSNLAYAVSGSIASSGTTNFIYALDGGLSVPSTATITGVEVVIKAKNQLSGNGFRFRHTSGDGQLRYAGTLLGSATTTSTETWVGTAESTKTLGSPTNLWSATLTPEIVNHPSFGFRGRFFNLNGSSQQFSIDSIIVIVYYTDESGNNHHQFFWAEV